MGWCKRHPLILLATIVSGIFVLFMSTARTISDGRFQLSVTIKSEKPIASYCACPVFDRLHAAYVTQEIEKQSYGQFDDVSSWFEVIDQNTFIIEVPLSGRDAPFGIEVSRTQFHFLVISVQFTSGEAETRCFEIPDCRYAKSLVANFD